MATININVGENDIININVEGSNETPKINKEDLYRQMREELSTFCKENNKRYWYEVWIDFSEDWDGIYEQIKNLDHQAAFDTCFGFLERMEAYYNSPRYYEDLNDMIKNAKFE